MKRRSLLVALLLAPLTGCIRWGRQPALEKPKAPEPDRYIRGFRNSSTFTIMKGDLCYWLPDGSLTMRSLSQAELDVLNGTGVWPPK